MKQPRYDTHWLQASHGLCMRLVQGPAITTRLPQRGRPRPPNARRWIVEARQGGRGLPLLGNGSRRWIAAKREAQAAQWLQREAGLAPGGVWAPGGAWQQGAVAPAVGPALRTLPPPIASARLGCHSSCHDAWADARPLGAEIRYICNIVAMISPLHFLEVNLARSLTQPVKSELDEEEEQRKRCREKNKVEAAPCRSKKKGRTEFLQRESEWLELMNAELKTQMEELKQEWQQLILRLNRHRPTALRPPTEGSPLLEHWREVAMGWERKWRRRRWRGRRRRVPEGSSLLHEKLFRGRTEALGQRDAQPGSCGHFSGLSARAYTQRTSEQPGKGHELEKGTVPGLLYPPTVVQLSPAQSGSRGTPSPALLEVLWAPGAGALPKHILTE
ncbi:LOW QUALITY PROTEIN: hypothetical protein QTO34_007940, partial [Cnephaeus nilssonii]